jgi:hypothetical protein
MRLPTPLPVVLMALLPLSDVRGAESGGRALEAQASSAQFTLVNAPTSFFQTWASYSRSLVTGDFNGDGRTDVAAVGVNGWTTVPVALSIGDGSFQAINEPIANFQTWASQSRSVVTGDFNGDGRTDIAAIGVSGWTTVPVALSNGNGSFRLVNDPIWQFQTWASQTKTVVTGDFNGDGRTDIAAVGAWQWSAIPVAFSFGNGSFWLSNAGIWEFQSWASGTSAVVTGDFNGDGRTDIAAVGANGWQRLPVALSNGDGSFQVVNEPSGTFQTWASQTKAVVTGDFNGDGLMDIAAVGADGWQCIPVALANGNGSFRIVNECLPYFQTWASQTKAVVTGDFNGDGLTDIAAIGANAWGNVPVALSNGNGSFRLANMVVPHFQTWASQSRAVVKGDFNKDGRTDVAAFGGNGWDTVPTLLLHLSY